MAEIQIKGVAKSFGSFTALHSIDLTIADQEFMVLLGASGCGKTTLLRIIAGLESPTQGEVWIGGKRVDQLPPRALEGVVAVPVTVAASAEHRLLADLHLRPVLAELGASLPVPSLTLRESELPELPEHLRVWTEAHTPALEAALALGRRGERVEVAA